MLSFHYQRCVPVSKLVKNTAFLTLTTKSSQRFQAKLENAAGVLFMAYFTKESPLIFSGDLCRTYVEGDWVVLWVIGNEPRNDRERPYEVNLTYSAEAPPGLFVNNTLTTNQMLGIQELEKEKNNMVTETVVPCALPQENAGKIEAYSTPSEYRVPSHTPSFKAFRDFLSS